MIGGADMKSALFYTPKHDVKPKVVATAVKIVMTIFRIFPQIDLFSIVFWVLSYDYP